MPQLKEILHAIVSDIAEAKSLANHTSVRRAEMYKSHPLLSSLPAPTMRLKNVTIDLPMIILAESPGTPGTTADADQVAKSITAMLKDAARVRGIALRDGDLEEFRQGFVRHTKIPLQDEDRLRGAGVRETFSRAVDMSLADMAKTSNNPSLLDQLGPLRHDLKHAAAAAALKGASEPTLTVDVRSDQIKVADPRTVTRIQFELTEDGLEWQRETDAPKRKLVPE